MADGSVKIDIVGDDSDIKKKIDDTEEGLKGLGDKQKETQKETEKTASKFEELANAIDKQTKELSDLKGEYTQAIVNFGKGSAEAKALEEKMSSLNSELSKNKEVYSKASSEAGKLSSALEKNEKSFGAAEVAIGSFVGNALNDLGSKLIETVGNIAALADETREYREDMAKLDTAFTTAGHSTETAQKAYDEFYKILGESDRSVEAVNHLAELTKNEQEVAQWSTIAAGVTAKFGDSLPIEGLTEAANETAKVGAVTGPLADALNWAGISEDEFNKKLAACNSEQERASLITSTLNNEYAAAAEEYNTLTASTQAARDATNNMEQAQAALGAAIEPVTTAWTNMKANALQWFVDEGLPALQTGWQWIQDNLPAIAVIVGGLTAAWLAFGGAQTILNAVQTAGIAIQTALNAVMNANHIGLIVLAITALVAGFMLLWNNCEGFRNFWKGLWEGIKTAAAAVADWFKTAWNATIEWLKGAVAKIKDFFSDAWNGIKTVFNNSIIGDYFKAIWETIKGVFSVVKNVLSGNWKEAWEAIKGIVNTWSGFFSGVWEKIKAVFSVIGGWFSQKFTEAKTAIISVFSNIGAKFNEIKEKIFNAFNDIKTKFLTIGKNIVDGIWDGISNGYEWIKGKIKTWVGNVVDFCKSILGIKSPSRVFRDEVGAMIVRGLELGIRKTSNVAIDAMKDLGTALIDEAIKAAEESAEALEETTTKSTTKTTSKSTSDTDDSAKKYNEFAKPSATNPDLVMSNDERARALGYKDFRDLQEKKYKRMTSSENIYKVIADSEEEAYYLWNELMQGNKVTPQEVWSNPDANGNSSLIDKRIIVEDKTGKILYNRRQLLTEEIKEQAKQTETANKKLLGEYKSYNEAIERLGLDGAAKLIANNKKLVESEVKTGAERVEQLKAFKSNYEKQLTEINKLEEDYVADSLKIQEQLNNDIQKVVEDYQNSFESRAEGIVSSLSLFEKAEKADTASGTQMVIALRSQVRVLEDYKTALDELSKRDVDSAFIEEMSSLGVDALPQLKAFVKMSDAQLNEYVQLWKDKSNLANEATEIALAQKREQTKQEIQALKDAANEESATLYMEYNTAMFELLEQVSTGMQEIGDAGLQALGEHIQGYVDMGKQLMAGIAEGLAQNGHLVGEELVGSVKSAMSKVKNEMGIHSPSTVTRDEIGKNLADGVAVGWSEKLNTVKGKMSADMRAITDRIKTAVSLEQARMAQGIGVRDTGFSEVAQAVGMQTAGINSLASEYRRGSSAQVTVPLVIDGRELGRAIVDLGNAETVRTGTSLSFT